MTIVKAMTKKLSLEEKFAKLEEAKKELEKQFGKRCLETLDSKGMEIESVETGSIGLDNALGGGFPKGRISEIYGWDGTCKTTVCLQTIASAQAKGELCAFVDAEQAVDREYAKNLGVKLDQLTFFQPDEGGEQALNYVESLLDMGIYSVIVVDSISTLTPKAELEGETGESKIGLHARMMSQALRKLVQKVAESNCALIFTNQLREKIGVMYGSPEVTTGGNAMRFYASIRVEMSKSVTNANSIEEEGERVANLIKYKVIKNKIAPPFRSGEFFVRYGEGVDTNLEVISLALAKEIISRRGETITYGEIKINQNSLLDNPEMLDEIKEKLKEN